MERTVTDLRSNPEDAHCASLPFEALGAGWPTFAAAGILNDLFPAYRINILIKPL